MLHINLFITLLCLWLFVYLNNKFLKVARINRVRYQLFCLRDELAVLAMKGEIDLAGSEYKTLRHMLNESIKILGTFSIVSFLRYAVAISQNKELQARLDKIISSLQKHGNEKFREIVFRYFKIMHTTFDKNTRLLAGVLLPSLIIIIFPLVVLREVFRRKVNTLKAADMYFETRTNQLTPLSAISNCRS